MQRRRRSPNAPPVRCRTCPTKTAAPRKGQCGRCYQNDYHGREKATACECCAQGDPRTLVRKRLACGMRTLCGNCGAIAGRRPLTLGELRAEVRVPSDRRCGDRRHADRRGLERRVRPHFDVDDRRTGDRRSAAA